MGLNVNGFKGVIINGFSHLPLTKPIASQELRYMPSFGKDSVNINKKAMKLIRQDEHIARQLAEDFRQKADSIEIKKLSLGNKEKAEFEMFNGTQSGSNNGFWGVKKGSGELYYFKQGNPAQDKSEALASELYRLAGEKTPDITLCTGEFEGLASKAISGLKDVKNAPASASTGFGADAWLANWDAMLNGNTMIKNGVPYRIDVGGSLRYRARGEQRNFTGKVNELVTMFEKNDGAFVYEGMRREDLISSLKRIVNIPDESIIKTVEKYDSKDLADILIQRKKYLKEFLDEAVKTPNNEKNIAKYIKNIESKIHPIEPNTIAKNFDAEDIIFTELPAETRKKYNEIYQELITNAKKYNEEQQLKKIIDIDNCTYQEKQILEYQFSKQGLTIKDFKKLSMEEQAKVLIRFDNNYASRFKKEIDLARKLITGEWNPYAETVEFKELLNKLELEKMDFNSIPHYLVNNTTDLYLGRYYEKLNGLIMSSNLSPELKSKLENALDIVLEARMMNKGRYIENYESKRKLLNDFIKEKDMEKVYESLEINNKIVDKTDDYKDKVFTHFSMDSKKVIDKGFDLAYCAREENRLGTGVYANTLENTDDYISAGSNALKFKLNKGIKFGELPEEHGELLLEFERKIKPYIDDYAIKHNLTNEEYGLLNAEARAHIYKRLGYDAFYGGDPKIGVAIFNPEKIHFNV